jgi:transposase
MRDLDHSDHYCKDCDRGFDSANSLQMVRITNLLHIARHSLRLRPSAQNFKSSSKRCRMLSVL